MSPVTVQTAKPHLTRSETSYEKPTAESYFFKDHNSLPGSMVRELRRQAPDQRLPQYLAARVADVLWREVETFHSVGAGALLDRKALGKLDAMLPAAQEVLRKIRENSSAPSAGLTHLERSLAELEVGVSLLKNWEGKVALEDLILVKSYASEVLSSCEAVMRSSPSYRSQQGFKPLADGDLRKQFFNNCYARQGRLEEDFGEPYPGKQNSDQVRLTLLLGNNVAEKVLEALAPCGALVSKPEQAAKLAPILTQAHKLLGQILVLDLHPDAVDALQKLQAPVREAAGALSLAQAGSPLSFGEAAKLSLLVKHVQFEAQNSRDRREATHA